MALSQRAGGKLSEDALNLFVRPVEPALSGFFSVAFD